MEMSLLLSKLRYERVTQLVEYETFNFGVESSNLSTLTILEPSLVTVAIINALFDVNLTRLLVVVYLVKRDIVGVLLYRS